jgi:hypothetical protein
MGVHAWWQTALRRIDTRWHPSSESIAFFLPSAPSADEAGTLLDAREDEQKFEQDAFARTLPAAWRLGWKRCRLSLATSAARATTRP